ncbi:MAG: YggS family pyridoxal phosphate-dependent enzyme, partial [Saprospiraceae bacterium]|nr:YggS family pyridoxal phosphate-dependent enzyme [Saprospiraceae bacterium]
MHFTANNNNIHMISIENFTKVLDDLSNYPTQLVAVSKTKPKEAIQVLYNQGQRIFGENRVQELVPKHEALPKDIQWHLIGHLQSNKVKYIAEFVDTIHSVDSLKLLKEINKQAAKFDRTIKCLLQFHIAEEESKFGLLLENAKTLLNSDAFASMQNITIAGVMGMATFTDNFEQVRKEFRMLKSYFNQLKQTFFVKND